MLESIAKHAATGWLIRRAQELGALVTFLYPIYANMPQSMKDDVHAIFLGQGGGLTITAAAGLLWYIWVQVQSYRATTTTQAVTTDGTKIVPKSGSAVEAQIDEVASGVKPQSLKPTLWERIIKR